MDHKRDLISFIGRKSIGSDDAEDIAQEAFTRCINQYADTLKSGNKNQIRAILFTIARNLVYDFFRTQSRHNEQPDELLSVPDKTPGPEEQAISSQELTVVKEKLKKMPARMRRAFLLRRVEGWRYKTIADEMNISISLVEKEIAQAMAILMEQKK